MYIGRLIQQIHFLNLRKEVEVKKMEKEKENIQLLEDEDLDKVAGGIGVAEDSKSKLIDNSRQEADLYIRFLP